MAESAHTQIACNVRQGTSPEDFSQAVHGADLRVDFVSPGGAGGRLRSAYDQRGRSIDHVQLNFGSRVSGPLPAGKVTVAVMVEPAGSSWYGRTLVPGSTLIAMPGAELDGFTRPGYDCLSFVLTPANWLQIAEQLSIDRAPAALSIAQLQLSGPVADRLCALAEYLIWSPSRLSFERKTPLDIMADELALALMGAGESVRFTSVAGRMATAKRAEAWLRERLSEEISITDLCASLNISRRELEYAFQCSFGTSPKRHLTQLRLHAVRKALLAADGESSSVTEAALDCGVTHLGRFSAAYRRTFGEFPRETLRSSP